MKFLLFAPLLLAALFAADVAEAAPRSISVPDGLFAGTVTATVTGEREGDWVRAECFQGETRVYTQSAEIDAGEAVLTLGPTPMWTGGDAECTARLRHWTGHDIRTLAEVTFHVDG